MRCARGGRARGAAGAAAAGARRAGEAGGRVVVRARAPAGARAGAGGGEGAGKGKSEDYSESMQTAMGSSLTYDHSRGMNFTRILPELIVGSCLQTPADLDRLVEEEGVTTVLNLQRDPDMEYFDLDVAPIVARARDRGDVRHIRFPITDFCPHDLRVRLPAAVATILRAGHEGGSGEADTPMPAGTPAGTLYVHCTAGMGRAPGVALGYMYWALGMDLLEAHRTLTTLRPCHPKLDSIRQATADVLGAHEKCIATVSFGPRGAAQSVQVAGLDVGWGEALELKPSHHTPGRLELRRELLPGRYPYKFIVDGRWTFSMDRPLLQDGDSVNNFLDVGFPGDPAGPEASRRARLLAPEACLAPAERAELLSAIRALA